MFCWARILFPSWIYRVLLRQSLLMSHPVSQWWRKHTFHIALQRLPVVHFSTVNLHTEWQYDTMCYSNWGHTYLCFLLTKALYKYSPFTIYHMNWFGMRGDKSKFHDIPESMELNISNQIKDSPVNQTHSIIMHTMLFYLYQEVTWDQWSLFQARPGQNGSF